MNEISTLATQTTKFDDVIWATPPEVVPLSATSSPPVNVQGPPAGLRSGMAADASLPPYWEFTYQINTSSGISFTNVVVRNSQASGSREEVFENIDFADFAVGFTDGNTEGFNVTRAQSTIGSTITVAENGSIGADTLFQRGIRLKLVDNVLAHRGDVCFVTMEISVVFRGAKNDFDPGGVPVAMILWPEIAFTWDRNNATKSVDWFRGSVKMTVNNRMFPGHSGSGAHHTSGTPPLQNVASLFTDTNTGGYGRLGIGLRGMVARVIGIPFGWSQVFDYVKLDLQQEKEFIGVYGSSDGPKYSARSPKERERDYYYPIPNGANVMTVRKADRQGVYDNIHLHAKMSSNDSCGNVQIHAPFCGHSCVHMHWRWSNVSSNGSQSGPGWRYKGWSNPGGGGISAAHSTDDAPLIPPNQRLIVALCRPGTTRFNDDHIIDLVAPAALDPLRKLIYYSVIIQNPVANEKQVILNHGIGWAYRYATPSESRAVDGLAKAITDSLPWTGTPTQAQMATFFEDDVYPIFRYIGVLEGGIFRCSDQVPDGTWKSIKQPFFGGPVSVVSMEDL